MSLTKGPWKAIVHFKLVEEAIRSEWNPLEGPISKMHRSLELSPRPEGLISSLVTMTDEQAMWRVQMNDDHHAFAKLVARWEKPIFRLCARMTGDLHRGEDLKQEAFSKAFAKRKDYRPHGKFSTWLWRIALNLCYDELRRRQRLAKHLVDSGLEEYDLPAPEFTSEQPGPDLRLVQQEENDLIRKALLDLDEEMRTVIVLRFCEGLKLRQIAELLDLPESTVHSRIAAGLARLSHIIEPGFRLPKKLK